MLSILNNNIQAVKKLHIVHVLFFTISTFFSLAQQLPENVKFRHLSVEAGLSEGTVSAIYQDKEGFMWFGTADGLNKYDGYSFTIFRNNANDSNSIGAGVIRCIVEDSDGYLWVGSEESLSRFDRKSGKFKVFKNNPKNPNSLSNNIIIHIFEDRDKTLWISTYGGGLNKFDKKTECFFSYKYDKNNKTSISSDFVMNTTEDTNGTLWIATFENPQRGGLNSFNKITKQFTRFESDEQDYANHRYIKKNGISPLLFQIQFDKKGIMWIANGSPYHGLLSYDTQKNKITQQYIHSPTNQNSLSDNCIQCIYNDTKDNVWVGTINGLSKLDKKTNKFSVFKNNPTNQNSLSDNAVTCLFEDNQGLIWIGTNGGGINIYDPSWNNFIVFKNNPADKKSLNSNKVYSIFQDSKKNFWLGTEVSGLTQFNPNTNEFNFIYGDYFADKKRTIRYSLGSLSCINEVDSTFLYVGSTSSTVFLFNRLTHKYSLLPSPYTTVDNDKNPSFIYDLIADSNQHLWVASSSGLFQYQFKEEKKKYYKNDPSNPFSISDNYTVKLLDDLNQNIWIATYGNGLNVYEKRTQKFYCFKNSPNNNNSINSNAPTALCQTKNGVLWIGTNGGGLNALVLTNDINCFKTGYKFYHFTEKDGLPNNVIQSILPDNNGNLWITTNAGLCKFTPPSFLSSPTLDIANLVSKAITDNGKALYKNYDINSGLPSNSFTQATLKTDDNLLYFGNTDGLIRFNPNEIKDNTHIPSVYLTSFKIFEKEYALDTPIVEKKLITLSYKQNFFSFEFTALDYAQPSKNQFAYMMEGFDKEWINTHNRRYASYTNLNPGEYLFRVKASNNNGIWNNEGATIKIIITPPFWKTKTFYFLCILSSAMLLYIYIKWRERKLIKEKKLLENQVALRTNELVKEKEKVELANIEIIEKNHQITDSINYAKRIQQAILPAKKEIQEVLPQSFVLYKPKDIVSGDFYFFKNSHLTNPNKIIYIAAADCTGHGVPGAFMSMIGSEKLHDAVQQLQLPGDILNFINKGIKTSLHQSGDNESTRDGMDIAFCSLDLQNNMLLYSGANRPLYLLRKNCKEVNEIKATKHAIAGFTDDEQHFVTHQIQLSKGDTFYISTDGYADQFGGENEKKFTTKKFKQLLLDIQHLPMEEQGEMLETTIDNWSKGYEQIDDILVIGVRI